MAGYRSFGLPGGGARQAIGPDEAVRRLKAGLPAGQTMLPYGNGRSYGDSCLNDAGVLVDMYGNSQVLTFDPDSGRLIAEAGTMLSDIIAHAGPTGWFPAVVPGTRHVTLGGAIANDVHGKNHHRRGTFGCHVEALSLLRSDGVVYQCSASRNPELFRATIGGMGLTGLILSAEIRLMKVASTAVMEKIAPFRDLTEYFALAEAADEANEYAVAWIDQLAGGSRAGRGLLLTGNHTEPGEEGDIASPARLGVPFQPPFNVLNRPFLRLFNAAYHGMKGRDTRPHRVPAGSFFFPLDGVRNWNRLYGPRGLYQHQSVVPFDAAPRAVAELLRIARDAAHGSFLTVLKRFGTVASPGIFSFPRPGYTLTLDFPNSGPRTLQLLERLDRIAVEAGGAVNPYKDARMGADVFAASFPDWGRLERLRDPAFQSDFWRRTAMVLPVSTAPHAQAAE